MRVLWKLSSKLSRVEPSLNRFESAVHTSLEGANQLIQKFRWLNEQLPVLERTVEYTLAEVSKLLGKLDQTAAQRLEETSLNVELAGRKAELAVTQFTRQTSQVVRSLRYPAGRASAFLKGILVALKTFKTQGRETPLQDEEIFI